MVQHKPPAIEVVPQHAAERDPLVVALKKALENRPGNPNPGPASTAQGRL